MKDFVSWERVVCMVMVTIGRNDCYLFSCVYKLYSTNKFSKLLFVQILENTDNKESYYALRRF